MLASEGYTAKVAIVVMPMAKPYGGTQSETEYAESAAWGRAMNQWAWSVFLPESMKALATDWRVSLLVDPPANVVANLPPTYVQVCTMDTLRDEGLMFADNMEALGKLIGKAEHNVIHGGLMPGANKGGPGEKAMEEFASVLQRRFSYE
jgi:acetyl esterase/lipase